MSTINRPVHSPLGASGAERWMNCPGSVALLKELQLPETDEPDYRREGTAAHEAAARCLLDGTDAWEIVGQQFNNTEIDAPAAEAIQVYLDECRSLPPGETYVEFGIDAPEFHHQFYGTLDFGRVVLPTMYVRDYKHGEGIVVEVEWNPQFMYYAYGKLRHHPEVEIVNLGVVQPRAFHPEGPVRTWEVSADTIRLWAEETLKPAMLRTELDSTLDTGPWCRFCPAKLVCPLLTSLFGAACTADPKVVVNMSDESLGRSYQYREAVKFYLKALEDEAFRRLNTGKAIAGIKLVPKKANRVYKDGAKEVLIARLGDKVFTEPEIKSPAEIEKLGTEAKKLVKEWAYTPMTGLTVALESDKRPGVKVQTTLETFPQAAAMAAEA